MPIVATKYPLSGLERVWIYDANALTREDKGKWVTTRDIASLSVGGGSDSAYQIYDPTAVTGDQATALQAAIDAAVSNGKILRINKGVARHGSSLTIACPVLFDQGAGLDSYSAITGPDPVADAVTVTFQDLIFAPRDRRVFFYKEVREATAQTRVSIAKPQTIYPEWFDDGSKNVYSTFGGDWSMGWQAAGDALRTGGKGGTVQGTNGKRYLIRWPLVFWGTGYDIDLNGSELISDMFNNNRGWGHIINIGRSTGGTSDFAKRDRIAANLNNNIQDSTFVDTPLPGDSGGPLSAAFVYKDNTESHLNAFRIDIYGGKIGYMSTVWQGGNYGVQFSNAANCSARNIETDYCSQMFGFGSDVAPQNPFAYQCLVENMWSRHSNPNDSFYCLGFFGYANDCHARNVHAYGALSSTAPSGVTSADNNGVAFNYAYNCTVDGFSCRTAVYVTNTTNSAGCEMGRNARRCHAYSGRIYGFKRACRVVSFQGGNSVAGDENIFADIVVTGALDKLSIEGTRAIFINVCGTGNTTGTNLYSSASGTYPANLTFINTELNPSNFPTGTSYQQLVDHNISGNRHFQDRGRWAPTGVPATTGVANTAKVTITIKDGYDQTIPMVMPFDVWLSDDVDGQGVTATAPTGGISVLAASGTVLTTQIASKYMTVQSLKTGVFVLTILDTVHNLYKVCASMNGATYVLCTMSAGNYA